MPFTDPIVANEELVRAAINSSNYVQGTSGWRVARDGSAEFNSLTVRDSLNVQSITLDGVDLDDRFNEAARGCVGYIRGYPTTATTTEDAILWTEVDFEAGRMYEMFLANVTADLGNANQIEFTLRYVTGTASWPNNGSPIVCSSLRLSQFQLASFRALSSPTVSERYRFRVSISSLDGATVRSWGPGGGAVFAIYDVGPAPVNSGSANNVPPGKTLKEWTHSSGLAARYRGNGTLAPGATPLPSLSMSQGDFADGQGNYRSWCVFGALAMADFNDAIGVPLADILVCECYFNYDYWYNGSGWATIGYHNKTTLGSIEQAGGVPNVIQPFYTGTGGLWTNLMGTPSFMNAINTGYFEGFMIGNNGSSDKYYTGFAMHTAAVRPALHMKYYK